MLSSPHREAFLGAALGAASLAYPILVFFSLRHVPPILIGIAIAGLALLRITIGRRADGARSLDLAIGLAAAGVIAFMLVDPLVAIRLYPLFVSLGLAIIFGYSLAYPPSPIERIARLTEPDLPPEGVAYIRKVTWAWLGFFLVNATIAAWTIRYGTIEQWTLYNGFISYLLIGTLFTVEYLIRRRVRRSFGRRA
jgi:uncharacterized membrane protein